MSANLSQSSLDYGLYEFEKYGYVMPPPLKHNGGWFSGQGFNGEHGTVPVVADVDDMMYRNLESAKGVSEARFQYPGINRAGNNTQQMTGIVNKGGHHCISDAEVEAHMRPDEKIKRVVPHDPQAYQSGGSTSMHAKW